MKKVLTLLLLLTLFSPLASAALNPNFTPMFDTLNTNDRTYYNQSVKLDPGTSTPWEIWLFSGVLGILLVALTLRERTTAMGLEVDAILSAMAYVPIGFCAWTSIAVSRVTSYGVAGSANQLGGTTFALMEEVTLYSFPIIRGIFAVLFIINIFNTVRILAHHKLFKTTNNP